MTRLARAVLVTTICLLALVAACTDDVSTAAADVDVVQPVYDFTPTGDDPITPLPTHVVLDARKVALGESLFRDPILSPEGDVACVTCHELGRGGCDGRRTSDLPGHAPWLVNTPTIFNVAYNFKFHWGGAFTDLDHQLTAPVTSPRALATTYDDIVKRLSASAEYRAAFQDVFSDGVTAANFRDVMVTYERSLITPNARFDQYLRGDKQALTDEERAGYELFKSHGCISCHQGVNIGGNMFQRFGALRDYFVERGRVTEGDLGRYNVTKREEDRHVFRVPSLRNVAVTAPYFHDGAVKTLEEAVQIMSEYQLGRPVTDDQLRLLVAFLKTLTGEYQGKVLL